MRLVLLESPFSGDTERNRRYAQEAMRDCFARGEAPLASHLLYPGVLDDSNRGERALGIRAGLLWGENAVATVVYIDHGLSQGMLHGIEDAQKRGRPVEYRALRQVEALNVGREPAPDSGYGRSVRASLRNALGCEDVPLGRMLRAVKRLRERSGLDFSGQDPEAVLINNDKEKP